MIRIRILLVALAFFVVQRLVEAADEVPLASAQGVVEKADKDNLVILPRGPDGKFAKSLSLKLTGTSRVTTLRPQVRDGKTILTQKETEAKDLHPKQSISVIYGVLKEGPVLLSAVVEPFEKK